MNKVIEFRVYPDSRHGFYFDVKIFPTVEKMRKFAQREKGDKQYFAKAEAACLGFHKGKEINGRIYWSKTLGTFVFHRNKLGTEVIAHEASHAALRWMEAKRLSVIDRSKNYKEGQACDNEEMFCYALGRMARQIVEKCYENNLYE